MSDVTPGGRVPDPAYPVDVPPTAQTYPATSAYSESSAYSGSTGSGSTGSDESKAKQVASEARTAATQAAGDVKDTAKEQAQRVTSQARSQARNVASEVRQTVTSQARSQNDKLVSSIRQTADHLEEMGSARQDSPAGAVVARIADGGRQFADYLDRNGPDGVLREVQDFARRRPGAFLATALAAGFVVGRLGKSVAQADENAGKPGSDSFESRGFAGDLPPQREGYVGTGYAESGYVPAATTGTTEYASTGTGTPVVVDETYPTETYQTGTYPGQTTPRERP